jgi:hypothetical protein
MSHVKSEHNVGWDREDRERKAQNKERAGEGACAEKKEILTS